MPSDSGTLAAMTRNTYRVTASLGGWRSLPWPFGLLDIDDDGIGIGIRSWHWSWWLPGRKAPRSEIERIDVRKRFAVVTLYIRVTSGKPWKVLINNFPQRVLTDLRKRGYLQELDA